MNKLSTQEYEGLRSATVFVRTPDRTIVEVSGSDSATFLHNLCTNDMLGLQPGSGCEAFFTTVQGKTLLHGLLYRGANSTTLSASPGFRDTILPHLDKYLIREDVTLKERTHELEEIWVGGATAANELSQLGFDVPSKMLAHTTNSVSNAEFELCRVPISSHPNFFVRVSTSDANTVLSEFANTGISEASQELFDVARIEAGFPCYGKDITADNLPQEVDRDAQAISFTKGCYLGQETVARIDALGHVNKQLVQLVFREAREMPSEGTELVHGDSQVGKITSACWSPAHDCPLALGYLKRAAIENRHELQSSFGAVTIAAS